MTEPISTDHDRHIVRTEAELRNIIKPPPSATLGKIAEGPVPPSPAEFLASVRLTVLVGAPADRPLDTALFGGPAGFVTQADSGARLLVGLEANQLDEARRVCDGREIGMLGVVPGVRHTLRVNGTASISADDTALVITPAESYAHCAKAFIRSKLWQAEAPGHSLTADSQSEERAVGAGELDLDAVHFIGASPFAFLGTSAGNGETDVSPRGDPAGFVKVVDRSTLFVPDRPGNRIADSLRNIIANPIATMAFLVPRRDQVLVVCGNAKITTDPSLCQEATVSDKTPKLGIRVQVAESRISSESALAASGLWDQTSYANEAELPTIGAMAANPDAGSGVGKRILTGVTDGLVGLDYKRNLY